LDLLSFKVQRAVQETQIKNRKMTKDEVAKHIQRLCDRDSEKVTGIFKNYESPAGNGGLGMVRFSYKCYPTDQNEIYEFYDGERYTIPRGIARHLNVNCFYREYQHLPGEHGTAGIRGGAPDGRLHTQSMQMSRKVHRYAFHSVEYMDDDFDLTPSNLLEVTVSP
jgi:hypothetical protein